MTNGQREATLKTVVQTPTSLKAPGDVINYIYKGPIDDKHNSRWQRQRFLRTTSVREHTRFVQRTFIEGSMRPINDTITFPLIDVNQVLQPHEDTPILTLRVDRLEM